MIDLASDGGYSTTGKSTGLVTCGDVSAKDLGYGVGTSPVVEELAGYRVGDDAPESCIGKEFSGDFSGECARTDEFGGAITQAKEGGEIDGQVDEGLRPWECRADIVMTFDIVLTCRFCG